MTSASLIYPNQLFKHHPSIKKSDMVFIFEEQLFFKDYQYPHFFHKKKLILHRSSMQEYYRHVAKRKKHTYYIDHEPGKKMKNLRDACQDKHIDTIYCCELNDYILHKRVVRFSEENNITLHGLRTPGFITPKEELKDFFSSAKHFHHNSFYIHQRKKQNILLDKHGPFGGKWSFDTENRMALKPTADIPKIPVIKKDSTIDEAIEYVNNRFPNNPGESFDFFYPYTYQQAEMWMKRFFKDRFSFFGSYEDAILKNEVFLYHSLLSSSLNVGLLTPTQVINQALTYATTNHVPLNSLEGFIRQILGWREFMRACYLLTGSSQRNSNFFNHHHSLPIAFYRGSTGILPIDTVIKRLKKYGYAHHIERLMILGNFMLLCEIHPTAVYQWFMDMFIDSYDWVMVPNVYGMSQFADGGLIVSKPYISSSNYIRKMSDFKKNEWCSIWDALFWRFIDKHQDYFKKNPRMKMLLSSWDKKERTKKESIKHLAESYLSDLHLKK